MDKIVDDKHSEVKHIHIVLIIPFHQLRRGILMYQSIVAYRMAAILFEDSAQLVHNSLLQKQGCYKITLFLIGTVTQSKQKSHQHQRTPQMLRRSFGQNTN